MVGDAVQCPRVTPSAHSQKVPRILPMGSSINCILKRDGYTRQAHSTISYLALRHSAIIDQGENPSAIQSRIRNYCNSHTCIQSQFML